MALGSRLSRSISYGPDNERFKQVNGDRTTYYVNGGLYEEIVDGGVTTQKSYVGGYLVRSTKAGQTGFTYLHKDHLGSVDAMTDQWGNLIDRMSFDPWGQRQYADWADGNPTGGDPDYYPTTKGYTGHEMLDQENLIHMNGRVYDPVIGRFLSPDLLIQAPYNTQSFNRYSYVFNNPLSLVDPSGYDSDPPDVIEVTGRQPGSDCRGSCIEERMRNIRETFFTQDYFRQQDSFFSGALSQFYMQQETIIENIDFSKGITDQGGTQEGQGHVLVNDVTGKTATIHLSRIGETDEATLGILTIDGTDFKAFTLEPAGPGSTVAGSDRRILPGIYEVTRFSSADHPNTFRIENVPGRFGILFHIGNVPADTAGCICLGQIQGTNAVYASGPALDQFRDTLFNYGSMQIIITNDFE